MCGLYELADVAMANEVLHSFMVNVSLGVKSQPLYPGNVCNLLSIGSGALVFSSGLPEFQNLSIQVHFLFPVCLGTLSVTSRQWERQHNLVRTTKYPHSQLT